MTKTSKTMLAVTVVMVVFGTGNALARQGAQSHMPVTGRTTQPIGHYEYCQRYTADCSITARSSAPTKLTRARWEELDGTNRMINSMIQPVTDLEYYKVEEYWTYPKSYGDCEDYVLLKRNLLIQKGWPASSLLITVVRQPNGDGHAVLTVRTDRADYILDNLRDKIMTWSETEYQFVKRQSAAYSGRWEGIDDNRAGIVGSVANR